MAATYTDKIVDLEFKLKQLTRGQTHVHPVVQWKAEVYHDDTFLGYEAWLKQELKARKGDRK
jgi:hypothetical protein